MKDIKTWAIVILGVVVILLLIFPGSNPPDTEIWKDAIRDSEQKIAVLKQDRARLAQKITEDSLKSIKRDSVYREDLKIKERRISELKANPTVIRIREEVPVIDTLILAYDSIVSFQQGRIYTLGKELEGLRVDIVSLTTNFEAQLAEAENTQNILLEQISKEQKELKKQVRLKRIFQATSVILPIAVLLL